MRERREFLRINDDLPIKYSKALKKEPFDVAMRENISGGGIKLILEEDLSVGTILALRIDIPDEEELHTIFATGQVVWSRKEDEEKYGVGIQFINIEEEDREKILEYVKKKINL